MNLKNSIHINSSTEKQTIKPILNQKAHTTSHPVNPLYRNKAVFIAVQYIILFTPREINTNYFQSIFIVHCWKITGKSLKTKKSL